MKKLLSLLSICVGILFFSCSDDNPSTNITISKDQLKQSAYANDPEKGIVFTATKPWSTEINYNTETKINDSQNWITLDPPNGEAGEVTIKVILSTNYTGNDRQATIRIKCGDTSITVIIEQKGQTETGNVPSEPILPGKYKKLANKINISNTSYYSGGSETHKADQTISYDNQNRVIKYEEYDYEKDNKLTLDWSYSYNYSDNTITCIQKLMEDEEKYNEYKIVYTLNKEQNVESWTSEYNEIGKDEIDKGKLIYKDGYFSEATIIISNSDPTTDQTIWQNGNLVKAGKFDDPKLITTLAYGDSSNNSNIDFNYLLSQSEWLDCLAFEEPGIKPFGYFGKRSANRIIQEKDSYNNSYHMFEYKFDADNNPDEITVSSFEADGFLTSRRIYSISYIDAK